MREGTVDTEHQSVSVAEARELILGSVPALAAEVLGIGDAVGRILAEEVRSEISIPPADNSAMDGFALRAEDAARPDARLRVIMDLPAGRRADRKLAPGEAARIMTGAAIPEGADAVVMVEDTASEGDHVRVRAPATPGQHIRRAGSDVRPGSVIAPAGTRLGPALIGMLAALGRTQVAVRARPRVALLATGDELVEPDRLRDDGRIASSNSYALAAALREIGAEPLYLGIAPDRPDEIARRFRSALACDAVISSGGVSVGDYDWIKQVLVELGGRMRLWRVRMRPGAPLAFTRVGTTPVFGLPGNPVSTLVTFELFARPALLAMMGHTRVYRTVEPARLAEDFTKPAGRAHFMRVTLERRDGVLHARATGDQSSGILLSMVRADGLAFFPEDATRAAAGALVPVLRLDSDDLRAEPGF